MPTFNYGLFLFQIAVIVGFSHMVGALFRRIGQPRVVGEMAAGIALGPTLFGLLAPASFHFLFPPASLGFLNALSQAGLAVFIFLVGVRVDFSEIREMSRVVGVTSTLSVSVPLIAGIVWASYLFPQYGAGAPLAFKLFVGTAMSITAFPVLARILIERNLLGTGLGNVALACAAVGDLVAWILLAAVVTLTNHDRGARPIWLTLVYVAAYLGVMLILGRILRAWAGRVNAKKLPVDSLLIFIVLALFSGAAGEWIGIHALVGAFIAGLATPRQFRDELIGKLEAVTLLLFMPLFFALTGIRTNLAFGFGPREWLDFVLIFLIAVASKWGGTTLGACATRMPWREACQLGLLMNTRGLVELIVLGVGLENGIISPVLFSMMVCMALVTTFMAAPLMNVFRNQEPNNAAPPDGGRSDRVQRSDGASLNEPVGMVETGKLLLLWQLPSVR